MTALGFSSKDQWGDERSRLRVRDQITYAVGSLLERPLRTILSTVLVGTGAALIVIVSALGSSASRQVSSRFDALRATVVEVAPATGVGPTVGESVRLIDTFPADARARAGRLQNVTAAGLLLQRASRAEIALSPAAFGEVPPGPGAGDDLYLADVGLAQAADLSVRGRWITEADQHDSRKVVTLGSLVADRLGITQPQGEVVIDGSPYALVGIVTQSPLRPELLKATIVAFLPEQARLGWDVSENSRIIVRTMPGAAQTIGKQIALQLRPDQPDVLTASAPPDPNQFRAALEGDTRATMRAFGAAGIALGSVATCVVWLAAVGNRRAAIGLLVALGARRSHVFRLILTECTIGGVIAGVAGASIGVMVVAGICIARDWQLVMSSTLAPFTVVATAASGVIAGALPAWAAARVNPVESLRS